MSHRLRDPKHLVAQYLLQGNAADQMGRYPGTLVNAPTWGSFYKNNLQAIEFDGNNQHINCGDVTQLNSVSQFSICFWMNQDVIDQIDIIFSKVLDGNNDIVIGPQGGNFFFELGNGSNSYGNFDYSLVVSALNWHHIALVFDGSQTGNINRMLIYVDGKQVDLSFTGIIPTTTPDMFGNDATIGRATSSLDGKLHDFRIYNIPLTNDEILKLYHALVPTY